MQFIEDLYSNYLALIGVHLHRVEEILRHELRDATKPDLSITNALLIESQQNPHLKPPAALPSWILLSFGYSNAPDQTNIRFRRDHSLLG